jgi:hypothetical protein
MMNEDEIRALLDRYEQAISSGDEKAISQCWEVPAFVISEQGAVAISSKAEVERFYAKAGQYYRAQGLVTTLARIERVEMLSEGLATADVAWEAELVQVEKRAQQRIYRVNPDAMLDLEGWARKMRQLWSERFDALEKVLEAEVKRSKEENNG